MRATGIARIAVLLAAACGVLAWAGLSTAASGEGPGEPPEPERAWLFRQGRLELGLQMGGGLALQHEPRDASVFAVLPRVGYVFYEVPRDFYVPGSFEVVLQPSYLTVFQDRTAHVGGLASLLKYNFRTGTNFTPFLEAGAGVSLATIRVPREGTTFNFILQTGVGLQYAISDRHVLSFQWLYHHLSNADTGDHNLGLNTSLFLLGFSTLY